MIKRKKLFLACGADLTEERDAVELIIQRKNNDLIHKGLYLEVVRWEQLRHDFGEKRAQEHYSSEIEKCDVIIILFFKRVGKYTKEEFDIAYNHFKSGRKPRHLYVYFKKWSVLSDEINSDILKVAALQKDIVQDEQIFIKFENLFELQYLINHQIDLLIKEFEQEVSKIPVEGVTIENEAKKLPSSNQDRTPVVDKKSVAEIAKRCGLFTSWEVNQHLKFEKGDILYFKECKFSLFTLEIKFRARRLILEKAEELGIRLDEPGDLSEKSKRIEALLIDVWRRNKDLYG